MISLYQLSQVMQTDVNRNWILVVEDNLDLWTIQKIIIPRVFPGVELVHAADEATALAYLQEGQRPEQPPPRLILQNFYLPDRTTGLRLVTTFKQTASPYHQVPLVVMSSSTEVQDSQEVLQAGADLFLPKPARLEDWVTALQPLRKYWPQS